MASPAPDFPLSSPVLDQWRGDRLTYSDVAWSGAAVGLVVHASLHFFSVVIPELERLLLVFAPAERIAFGITANAGRLAAWLILLVAVAVWGSLLGIASLAAVHEATDLVRRRIARSGR